MESSWTSGPILNLFVFEHREQKNHTSALKYSQILIIFSSFSNNLVNQEPLKYKYNYKYNLNPAKLEQWKQKKSFC